jgi:peptidyl-prolyl cis-trans isomerase SurA
MNPRAFALLLACALPAAVLHLPAGAQGLRPSAPGTSPFSRPVDNTPRAADYIVAVVNSEPITNNEVRSRMVRFEQQLLQQGQQVPPPAEFARQVLERLISEKAQLQLARETGVKVEEAQIDQAEQGVARQYQLDVKEFRRRLAGDGVSPEQFRQDLRNQLLLTRLREREFDNRIKVSDFEVEQYMRQTSQAAADPASQEVSLAHVLVAVPENASDSQVASLRARAQRVQERAKAGEDFSKLAKEYSDAEGAAQNGGLVGSRPLSRLPPLFVQAVQALPDGGVTDVIRSGAGFHVIKVVERRKPAAPGTVVQSHARHILLRPGPQLSESAAVQRLADFKRRIAAGQADFAQLAREFSQDASAPNGGDLGWAGPGLFVPEFEETLNSLKPGQIADPLVSRFGVHLVQLIERREARMSDREQREAARAALREKKLDDAYTAWAQEVRGRAYVELREPPR